jgi:hypothetical protein
MKRENDTDPVSKLVLISFPLLTSLRSIIATSHFTADCKFNQPTKSSKQDSTKSPHDSEQETDLLSIGQLSKRNKGGHIQPS